MKAENLISELKSLENKEKKEILQKFFKTGSGQYGEGDIFLGITVPIQRTIAKKYIELELSEIQKTIISPIHEIRLTSILILVLKYEKTEKNKSNKTNSNLQKEIYDFYLKNAKYVNNWDLVDLSAPKIVGNYILENYETEIYKLYQLAKSDNLWERRISIVSTYEFIKNHKFEDTIKISEILLNDKHDLIQKAVGWMLREMGKRDKEVLIKFLDKYHKIMPRTMLRYSIEKLNEEEKNFYMGK